ncbi:MAG: biotin--[acetyl-CoA-carboxylase] ligase [Bacteroidetes bacterium 4484_249]|nr:MAG: biotin--[acetyl-CoA-carboxylase] ligase [Bacteroidetes bacterium 4484_249]
MNIIGKNIIRLREVDSTNDYILKEIQNGSISTEGTIVVADNQIAGKGQDKNLWESEAGKNLTFSVLLKPVFIKAEQQFLMNKAISLGISDFVKSIIKEKNISIKWPNDIYINNKKVAGILINNTICGNEFEYSVVGIGINVNQTDFYSDAPNPVSLKHFLKKDLDLKKNLKDLCEFLNLRYRQLYQHNFDKIEKEYLLALYRFNEVHSFRYKNQTINSRITGVSDYGKLQLQAEDGGKIECDLKQIEFII